MAQKNKSAARQTRRDVRASARSNARLIASADQSLPIAPIPVRREPVKPLTDGQRRYDAAFKSKDIILGVGPAGTGKTWFAVQRAAEELKADRIKKIYVTRPAVEVGRGMGFLPGELNEKYEPYLIPLKEAFCEALGKSHYEYLLKRGTIEAVPLAFIRGRTLRDAWVIADEMQNATAQEFKALLTRIGDNSKFIINGDPTQTDEGITSGLLDAMHRLKLHPRIETVQFARDEIVRSGLCADIVAAYEEN